MKHKFATALISTSARHEYYYGDPNKVDDIVTEFIRGKRDQKTEIYTLRFHNDDRLDCIKSRVDELKSECNDDIHIELHIL